MIKKIFISSLLILFFVSTTSLPVTIHFCRIQKDMKSAKTCRLHHNSQMTALKCSFDNSGTQQITSDKSCCLIKTIDNSIKDRFVSSQPEKNITSPIVIGIVPELLINNSYILNQNILEYADTSPPNFGNGSLYLLNSVLII